jgi:hypothetical protein
MPVGSLTLTQFQPLSCINNKAKKSKESVIIVNIKVKWQKSAPSEHGDTAKN